MTNIDKFKEFYKLSGHDLMPFQEEIITSFEASDKMTIVLKSRQMFMSTLMRYYSVYQTLNSKKYVSICFISNKKTCEYFMNGVMDLLHRSDIDMKGMPICNYNEVSGKKFKVKTYHSPLSLRGVDLSLYDYVFVDEAAHIDPNFFITPYFTNNHTNKNLMYSSYNKKENEFQKLFDGGLYNNIILHYSQNKILSQQRVDDIKKCLGDAQFHVQYEMGFIKPIKKEAIINFRMDNTIKEKMESKVFRMSEKKGQLISISDYLRDLVMRDLERDV